MKNIKPRPAFIRLASLEGLFEAKAGDIGEDGGLGELDMGAFGELGLDGEEGDVPIVGEPDVGEFDEGGVGVSVPQV